MTTIIGVQNALIFGFTASTRASAASSSSAALTSRRATRSARPVASNDGYSLSTGSGDLERTVQCRHLPTAGGGSPAAGAPYIQDAVITGLNLKEVEEFDWTQTTTHCGVVDAREYVEFKKKGKPSAWSGSISGPNIKHVSNEEMDEYLANGGALPTQKYSSPGLYTLIEWEETYEYACGDFLDVMKRLRGEYPKDNIRLVFYFDS